MVSRLEKRGALAIGCRLPAPVEDTRTGRLPLSNVGAQDAGCLASQLRVPLAGLVEQMLAAERAQVD